MCHYLIVEPNPTTTFSPEVYFSDHPCCSRHVATEFYSRTLTQAEATNILRALLKRWHDLTREIGVDYWPAFGALLGAYRNGALVPYDDDIDIGMSATQLDQLMGLQGSTSIEDKNPEWIPVYESEDDVLRISPYWNSDDLIPDPRYEIDAKFIDKKSGMYIDVFSYRITPGDLVTIRPVAQGIKPYYPVDWVYPLGEIVLEDLLVKAPRQIERVLQLHYGETFFSPNHVHVNGLWIQDR